MIKNVFLRNEPSYSLLVEIDLLPILALLIGVANSLRCMLLVDLHHVHHLLKTTAELWQIFCHGLPLHFLAIFQWTTIDASLNLVTSHSRTQYLRELWLRVPRQFLSTHMSSRLVVWTLSLGSIHSCCGSRWPGCLHLHISWWELVHLQGHHSWWIDHHCLTLGTLACKIIVWHALLLASSLDVDRLVNESGKTDFILAFNPVLCAVELTLCWLGLGVVLYWFLIVWVLKLGALSNRGQQCLECPVLLFGFAHLDDDFLLGIALHGHLLWRWLCDAEGGVLSAASFALTLEAIRKLSLHLA